VDQGGEVTLSNLDYSLMFRWSRNDPTD